MCHTCVFEQKMNDLFNYLQYGGHLGFCLDGYKNVTTQPILNFFGFLSCIFYADYVCYNY